MGRLVTGSGGQLRPPVTVPAGTPESAISIGTVTAAGRQGGRLQLVGALTPAAVVRRRRQRLPGHSRVRATPELSDFSANLRAPIVIHGGRGHQLINEASDAPVRAALPLDKSPDQPA